MKCCRTCLFCVSVFGGKYVCSIYDRGITFFLPTEGMFCTTWQEAKEPREVQNDDNSVRKMPEED